MEAAIFILGTVSVIVATLRIAMPAHGINKADVFKDMAHLFVGGLIGYGFCDWRAWLLAGLLVAVELLAFFTKKAKP